MLAEKSLLTFISPASLKELEAEIPPVVLDVRPSVAFGPRSCECGCPTKF
jgi:hypothetical protein